MQNSEVIIPGKTRFGKWLVIEGPYKGEDGWSYCRCRCTSKDEYGNSCGTVKELYEKNLRDHRTKSCGECKIRLAAQREAAKILDNVRPLIDQKVSSVRQDVNTLQEEIRSIRQEIHSPSPLPASPVAAVSEVRKPEIIPLTVSNDLDGLRRRVESLLEPSRDDSEFSIARLKRLLPPTNYNPNPTIDELASSFERNGYFITPDQIFSIHQAISQGKPILGDGPPGVGKTELAKQIALAMGLSPDNPYHFHTLFCTPDIAKNEALYAWNDAKRLLDIQLVREMATKFPIDSVVGIFEKVQSSAYSERYLDVQSLLRPCVIPHRTVVLADEIDKTYPEFDSYLLDIVVNNRFEVPGFGPVGRSLFDPSTSPIFIFTTNRERELNRALARRMKPVWFDYLPESLESKVVAHKCDLDEMTAGRAAQFFYKIRSSDLLLHQPPSTAEVIETVRAIRDDGEEVSVKNLFQYHTHWVKFRRDFDTIKEQYWRRTTGWVESI